MHLCECVPENTTDRETLRSSRLRSWLNRPHTVGLFSVSLNWGLWKVKVKTIGQMDSLHSLLFTTTFYRHLDLGDTIEQFREEEEGWANHYFTCVSHDVSPQPNYPTVFVLTHTSTPRTHQQLQPFFLIIILYITSPLHQHSSPQKQLSPSTPSLLNTHLL